MTRDSGLGSGRDGIWVIGQAEDLARLIVDEQKKLHLEDVAELSFVREVAS